MSLRGDYQGSSRQRFLRLVAFTAVFRHHGNARYFLDGNRPLWYMLSWYSAPTVMHGIFFMVIGHSVYILMRYSATTVMYGIFYILFYFGLLPRAWLFFLSIEDTKGASVCGKNWSMVTC